MTSSYMQILRWSCHNSLLFAVIMYFIPFLLIRIQSQSPGSQVCGSQNIFLLNRTQFWCDRRGIWIDDVRLWWRRLTRLHTLCQVFNPQCGIWEVFSLETRVNSTTVLLRVERLIFFLSFDLDSLDTVKRNDCVSLRVLCPVGNDPLYYQSESRDFFGLNSLYLRFPSLLRIVSIMGLFLSRLM